MRLTSAGLCIAVLSGLAGARAAHAAEPTFVWAEAAEPSTVDPAKADVNQEMTVIRNVYDRLINYDLDHPDHLLPSLATSWKQDGTKWTLTLRDGVTFQNGQPFTADDVKATIERDLRLKQGQSYLIGDVTGVTVVDPHTVTIETKQPDGIVRLLKVGWRRLSIIARSSGKSNVGHILPDLKSPVPEGLVGGGRDEMAAKLEV